jgi:hypothetical protein
MRALDILIPLLSKCKLRIGGKEKLYVGMARTGTGAKNAAAAAWAVNFIREK